MNVSAYLIWLMLLFLLKRKKNYFFLAHPSYFTFLERLKYKISTLGNLKSTLLAAFHAHPPFFNIYTLTDFVTTK